MKSRRLLKAAEAIRETVSSAILFEARDPRIKNVTVLRAEAAPDMRTAKVYVSVMGDAKVQKLSMHGLESARGFIQSRVADRLQTRFTPVLKFVLDFGVQRSIEASRLLRDAGAYDSSEPAAEGETENSELADDDYEATETDEFTEDDELDDQFDEDEDAAEQPEDAGPDESAEGGDRTMTDQQ